MGSFLSQETTAPCVYYALMSTLDPLTWELPKWSCKNLSHNKSPLCVQPCIAPISLRVKARAILRFHLQASTQSHPLSFSHSISSDAHFLVGLHTHWACTSSGPLHMLFPFPGMLFPAGSALAHSLILCRSWLKCHLLGMAFPDQLVSHSSLSQLVSSWGFMFPHSPSPQGTHSCLHCWSPQLECKLFGPCCVPRVLNYVLNKLLCCMNR